MTPTPSGRYTGRVSDTADDRDHLFPAAHPRAAAAHLPPSVDLRRPGLLGPGLPPCWDQGKLSSCGAHMGSRIMCHLFPALAKTGFSRLQIYRDVRVIEGTGDADAGVETRDVFKSLQKTGAAPEDLWPYDVARFADEPPPAVYAAAPRYRLGSYARLTTAADFLRCLAVGMPFGFGVDLYQSFDGPALARTGVMTMPQPSEKIVGGHDVTAVGYVRNFKTDPVFLASGVDAALVDDVALIVDNSWGHSDWSPRFRGAFFMPLAFAADPAHGNDAWVGKL